MVQKNSIFSVKFLKENSYESNNKKDFRWFGNTENFQPLIQTSNQMSFD